jgi:hypothetical protein
MSDDTKDKQSEAETVVPEESQRQSIHAALKNLRRGNHGGVRFVKMSGLGPITIHSTGPSDTSKP